MSGAVIGLSVLIIVLLVLISISVFVMYRRNNNNGTKTLQPVTIINQKNIPVKGPPGGDGANGANGVDGLPGQRGQDGKSGAAGPDGKAGLPGANGAGDNVVTYQPDGVASGTIFTDFASLVTYVNTNGNNTTQWIIQIDGSFSGNNATIAPGTYALPISVQFVGLPNSTNGLYPSLRGANVIFSPPPSQLYFNNISNVNFTGSTPVTIANSAILYSFLVNSLIQSADVPFFSVTTGATLRLRMLGGDSSGLVQIKAGASPIIVIDDISSLGSFGSLVALDTSQVTWNGSNPPIALTNGGASTLHFADSAIIDANFYLTPISGLSLDYRTNIISGTATLNAAPVTVNCALTSTSRIVLTRSAVNASTALGALITSTRVPGAPGSFNIESRQLANPGAVETGDLSSISWHVIYDTGNYS